MKDPHRVRRSRARQRRDRSEAIRDASDTRTQGEHGEHVEPELAPELRGWERSGTSGAAIGPGTGWDHDAPITRALAQHADPDQTPLAALVLSLFAEPGIYTLTPQAAADAITRPLLDVENALEALTAAGELVSIGGASPRYHVSESRKAQLEHMFEEAALELGETQALARYQAHAVTMYDDGDEPRLPVTAGLLSLFLPGTGQLLNGDVGRASLVFAVWSLALLTHLSPIWTFVALYAGAEAFFTAKVRGIERRLELEAAPEPEPEPSQG